MSELTERIKERPLGRRLADSPAVSYAWLRARAGRRYLTHGHARRRATVRRYLATATEPRLQIGAGPSPLAGWLNSDLVSGDIYVDLTRNLPLPDRSFAYVFGEHVIEHIPESAGQALLAEAFRVLRPGGVLRVTTPDLPKIIAIYEDRNPVISRSDYSAFFDTITGKQHDRGCQVFNDYMHMFGHRYIYDEEDLTHRLQETGFVAVSRHESGESNRPLLRGIERHGPPWENAAEAMCLEAVRPG